MTLISFTFMTLCTLLYLQPKALEVLRRNLTLAPKETKVAAYKGKVAIP